MLEGTVTFLRKNILHHLFSLRELLCVVIEFVFGGSFHDLLLGSRVQNRQNDSTYVNISSSLTEIEFYQITSDVANGTRHLENK